MTETTSQNTAVQDPSLKIINSLAMLDLQELSFVQLRRLLKALQHAGQDVARESERRTESDDAGDTVRVPSAEV